MFLAGIALAGNACTSMQPVILTAEDEGRKIELSPEQDLVLNLDSDLPSGYRWRLVSSKDPGISDARCDALFEFAPYIARMRETIAAVWELPRYGEDVDRRAVVYFRVQRDGRVTDVKVETSSGVPMFDGSCERAVLEASPLSPLPDDYTDEYVGVHFSFIYMMDVLIQQGPPGYASHAETQTGGFETWRFKAVRPGSQVLRFEYRRSQSEEPKDVLTFTVRVK